VIIDASLDEDAVAESAVSSILEMLT